jgi:hypothetical protein
VPRANRAQAAAVARIAARNGERMKRETVEQVGHMDAMNLEQKQREEARWRILRVLDAGRPIAVSESIVWRVLADVRLAITLNALRRELSYLRDRGLLEIEGEDNETWYARLTASGVDVVEYTAPAPAGIARPRKYW